MQEALSNGYSFAMSNGSFIEETGMAAWITEVLSSKNRIIGK